MHRSYVSRFSLRTIIWFLTVISLLLILSPPPIRAEYKGKYPYRVGTTVGMIADIV